MELDDEILGQFLEYVDQAVTEMDQHLTAMDNDPDNIKSAVDGYYGVAHNLKGMGVTFGYDLLTEVGTLCCRFIKDHEAPNIDILRDFYKVFALIIEHRIDGDGGEQGPALVARMEEKVKAA